MCRNIRVLHNFEPPTNDDEAFERAIDEIADATRRLLDGLVTNAPPKSRELEAVKGRERHEKRMEREVRIRTATG
jgi:hypothetical protein